ncbi:hypothetical protein [Aquidulcibacter sp.]|uniref:hypothetical protein n=1 Tax=Aquidulcibacter sp. TaxID=2052990 RepID=UPI0025BCF1CE|nr:hypothetical protein [Aquidulcibacter sp.]MCA3694717.1 hypothetical protein [Aquidulcibacter sp.]
MKRQFLAIALTVLATACATAKESGIRDPERFRAIAETSTLTSTSAPEKVARCFEDRAVLLPMTTFNKDEASGTTTYRLRGYGYTFEEIDFVANQDGGSVITTFLAPGVNAKWRSDFEVGRLAVLRSCAA